MVSRNNKNHDPFLIKQSFNKNYKLGFKFRTAWLEHVFLTKNDETKEIIGRVFDFKNILIIKIILFFLFILLFSRIYWLQVVKSDYYASLSEGNRIRIERIDAKRGIIYDRNLKPLVQNVANFVVYLTPSDLPKDEVAKKKILAQVQQIISFDQTEIDTLLHEIDPTSFDYFQPILIADNLSYDQAMLIYLESVNLPGITLNSKNRREYNPTSISLSHVMGYVGKINSKELKKLKENYSLIDYLGKSGVESYWEKELRGVNGKKQIEVDALGKEKKTISEEQPADGNNLVLAIDIEAQQKLEELISKKLSELGLTKASGIVMNPNNGEIIS